MKQPVIKVKIVMPDGSEYISNENTTPEHLNDWVRDIKIVKRDKTSRKLNSQIIPSEVTGVRKIKSNGKEDTFEYRDMYNDVQTITFPSIWAMTEDEVEEYLTADN